MTRFRMVSSGKELHHMTIVKLAEGKTMDSLMAAMAVPGPIPAWVTFIGGPNPSAPGGESNATVYMEPGNYAVFCVVDTPDHQMHVLKGMVSSLSVVPATTPVAMTLPEPTITVTMNEYTFALDKPLTAGKHSIRLLNTGMEPHEFVLIKMEPGKTLMDLGMWMEKMEGPLPGVPMGGLSPATNGRDGQFDVDITDAATRNERLVRHQRPALGRRRPRRGGQCVDAGWRIALGCLERVIVLEHGRAIGADDLSFATHVEIDMRVIVGRGCAHALELLDANPDPVDARVIDEMRYEALSHGCCSLSLSFDRDWPRA
jgi:hypothetical protein